MPSKKRPRTMYSADDYDDDDQNITLVHEEQTSYQDTRATSSKIVSFSKAPACNLNNNLSILAAAVDLELSKNTSSLRDIDADIDDFFSSSVHDVVPASSNKASVPVDIQVGDGSDSDTSDDDSDGDDVFLNEDESPKTPRSMPLNDFKELRIEYIQHFMRRYSPSFALETCSFCGLDGASLICSDCCFFTSRCQDCLLKEHKHLPLHRIQYFDGGTWQKTTLRELGLIVHLGHNGNLCPSPSEAKRIVVIDINGIQEIYVAFCSCDKLVGVDATPRSQLIRHGWFPATTEQPGTVATFFVLDAFEALSGEGKLSGYHFYKSLVRIKDGAGYETIPRRYEEFMRMSREYQHLKMLLRIGRTSELGSILGVADGELTVQCPACPHPGQNIPDGWDKKIDSWIYTLYVMVDANFRLKSKKKRTKGDQDLEDGGSYFVREEPYMEHVEKTVHEKEIKYCDSGLRAVDHANLKGGKGYDASGVVGIQCRHMMIRANGVGDLQKGEKYANVDYVVLSSLKASELKRIIISYDISCQYSRHFTKRMLSFDTEMQLDLSKLDLGFVIPQFHIAGHGDSCRTRFNLRFRENVGRTDGENIERGWALLNPLSMASKEMGRGARHDYLNWHIGDFNYQRIVSFGSIFSRKLKEAINESLKHSQILSEFRTSFPKPMIREVEEAIRKWDLDPHGAADPYSEGSKGKLLPKTKKKLTESELRREVASLRSSSASEAQWLAAGIEIEDKQYETKILFKGKDKAKSASDLEKNAQLVRKIRTWKSEQLLHMPRLPILPEWKPMTDQEKGPLRCWKYSLNLPSSLTHEHRQFACSDELVRKERELRHAQAYDSLVEIRHLIQRVWWLKSKKRKHVSGPGQKINTKSNCAIDLVCEQRDAEVARYRRARNALVNLEPEGQWQTNFRVLQDEDVRHYEDDEGKGEGRRTTSWIWRVSGATECYDEDAETYEGLKVEYAKARARAFRWLEEVQLIREEMRRVITYFNFKIGWWLEKNARLVKSNDDANLGAIVHGNRQIVILQKLGKKFWQIWRSECDMRDLPEVRSDDLIIVKKVQLPQLSLDP